MLFLTLGPSSLPVVVTQPDERHANRTASVLECYDTHRAKYNIWFKQVAVVVVVVVVNVVHEETHCLPIVY